VLFANYISGDKEMPNTDNQTAWFHCFSHLPKIPNIRTVLSMALLLTTPLSRLTNATHAKTKPLGENRYANAELLQVSTTTPESSTLVDTYCSSVSQVNTDEDPMSPKWRPDVATLENGEFVIVWESLNQTNPLASIVAQQYTPMGNKINNEIQINTYAPNPSSVIDRIYPQVISLADGGYLVTWSSTVSNNDDVYGRQYDHTGMPATTTEFLISAQEGNQRFSSAVQLNDPNDPNDSNIVVAWTNQGFTLDAQLYNASMGPINSIIQLNETASLNPDLATHKNGKFVAAWKYSTHSIQAGLFYPNGTELGKPVVINDYSDPRFQAYDLKIAKLVNGDYVVAWAGRGDGDSQGIFARRLSSNLTKLGTELRVTPDIFSNEVFPAISGISDGFIIAWQDHLGSLFCQRFSLNGTRIGSTDIQLNPAPGSFPTIDTLSDDRFVLTWNGIEGDGIYFRICHTDLFNPISSSTATSTLPSDTSTSSLTTVTSTTSGSATQSTPSSSVATTPAISPFTNMSTSQANVSATDIQPSSTSLTTAPIVFYDGALSQDYSTVIPMICAVSSMTLHSYTLPFACAILSYALLPNARNTLPSSLNMPNSFFSGNQVIPSDDTSFPLQEEEQHAYTV
jgi:hypothetical protein